MNATLVLTVIVALLFSEVAGAAGLDGPLMRAAVREAGKLSGEPVQPSPLDDWSRVVKIPSAMSVQLTIVGDPQPLHRLFVVADDAGVVVLNVSDPALPKAVVRALTSFAQEEPQSLGAVLDRGSAIETSDVRVNPDGVFYGTKPRHRIADVSVVLERVARGKIATVTTSVRRGPLTGALVGVTAGIGAGFLIAVRSGVTDCRCSGKNTLILSTIVGVPIAGGVLAYRAGLHTETTLIYRAAPDASF